MAKKIFKVEMEIEATSKEQIERCIDRMPHTDDIFDVDIIDMEERHMEARIRYEENWRGEGEHYLFESRWSDEEWGLEIACPLVEDRIHYTALTKIREWQKLGIPFRFE